MTDQRRRPEAWVHQACACREWCGDVPEGEDLPTAVCKGLVGGEGDAFAGSQRCPTVSPRDRLLAELRGWELRSAPFDEGAAADTVHSVGRGCGGDAEYVAASIPYWRASAIEGAIWTLGHLLAGLDPEVGFD